MIPTGLAQFQLSYQIAPIVLVGGIAAELGTNGQMSILQLTEGTSDPGFSDPNDYFAHFKPLPGSTLEDWSMAEYPFASFVMAANAMVQNALKFSLLMLCPARAGNPYPEKSGTISGLKAALDAHISQGGTFNVATPAYTYTNCLLVRLSDVSSISDTQVQLAYQWDFVQPLITQAAAAQSYNQIYTKLAGQLPTPNPLTNSGPAVTVGNAPTLQPPGQLGPP
jgi:hypothetical protein